MSLSILPLLLGLVVTQVARLQERSPGEIATLKLGDRQDARLVAFSPDGRLLASGGYSTDVRVWDVSTARRRYTSPTRETVRPCWGVRIIGFIRSVSSLFCGQSLHELRRRLDPAAQLPVAVDTASAHAGRAKPNPMAAQAVRNRMRHR